VKVNFLLKCFIVNKLGLLSFQTEKYYFQTDICPRFKNQSI
jgi:hypothetical protein